MKISQSHKNKLSRADSLEVVWFDGDIFMGWEKSAGYAIRVYNSAGWFLLSNRAGVPLVWKTPGGAFRAASRLRPDILDIGRGIS